MQILAQAVAPISEMWQLSCLAWHCQHVLSSIDIDG